MLLADDIRITRSIARRILEDDGHFVEEVEDGRAAVDAALGGDFDLVLLDISMPRMGGREAAREIAARFLSERFGYARPSLVALTAYAPESGERSLSDAGFDDYIVKPASRERLIEAARRAVAGKPSEAPDLDIGSLLDSYGGDRGFLRTILEVFVADGTKVLATIRRSLAGGDRGELLSALHSLVNIMGSGRAYDALARARAAEAELRGDSEAGLRGGEAGGGRGLEEALAQAERAIESAAAYLRETRE